MELRNIDLKKGNEREKKSDASPSALHRYGDVASDSADVYRDSRISKAQQRNKTDVSRGQAVAAAAAPSSALSSSEKKEADNLSI